jgi:hypothetical protein
MLFTRIIQHLLPRAKAWSITIDKRLRQFFSGLAEGLPPTLRQFYDEVYGDVFPQTTRELAEWENQFALPATVLTEQQRRDRLDGAWKAFGGQSPRYIQDTLRNAGFDVYIHEWWQLPAGTLVNVYYGEAGQEGAESNETEMLSGNIIGTVALGNPQPRNPFDHLSDGESSGRYFLSSGAAEAISGGQFAISGATSKPKGYLLVNKPAGGPYNIPLDTNQWRYILYVGGPNFGDVATVSPARRAEFEALLLKICPAQQWLGVIVEYA